MIICSNKNHSEEIIFLFKIGLIELANFGDLNLYQAGVYYIGGSLTGSIHGGTRFNVHMAHNMHFTIFYLI
jgi:hypothetical protein